MGFNCRCHPPKPSSWLELEELSAILTGLLLKLSAVNPSEETESPKKNACGQMINLKKQSTNDLECFYKMQIRQNTQDDPWSYCFKVVELSISECVN